MFARLVRVFTRHLVVPVPRLLGSTTPAVRLSAFGDEESYNAGEDSCVRLWISGVFSFLIRFSSLELSPHRKRALTAQTPKTSLGDWPRGIPQRLSAVVARMFVDLVLVSVIGSKHCKCRGSIPVLVKGRFRSRGNSALASGRRCKRR